jgi:hypothetical protein
MMAYSPTTGETTAKPSVKLFQTLMLRWSLSPGAAGALAVVDEKVSLLSLIGMAYLSSCMRRLCPIDKTRTWSRWQGRHSKRPKARRHYRLLQKGKKYGREAHDQVSFYQRVKFQKPMYLTTLSPGLLSLRGASS